MGGIHKVKVIDVGLDLGADLGTYKTYQSSLQVFAFDLARAP